MRPFISWQQALPRLLAGLATGLMALPALALDVFACGPEWAALVRELVPAARVVSATHARQDPHHIEARPALIAALRRADVAVCTGAGLEEGWLPVLQERAANPRVQPGANGLFFAARHVTLLDPRPRGSPFDGDVHPEGNPHVHLDPRLTFPVARALADTLGQVDPGLRPTVNQQLARLEREWPMRIAAWERRAEGLRGLRVVVQHGHFSYLWRWLGVEAVIDLEPKPGMPPTAAHLQRMLAQARALRPRLIVVASFQDPRPARWLSEQTGLPVVQLPATVSDELGAPDLAALFDTVLTRLLEALPR